jgi:hypothetical protein
MNDLRHVPRRRRLAQAFHHRATGLLPCCVTRTAPLPRSLLSLSLATQRTQDAKMGRRINDDVFLYSILPI